MSKPKPKAFPINPQAPQLAALMQSCLVIIAINWLFQGVRGMDRRELAFRGLLFLALTAGFAAALGAAGLGAPWATTLGALLAHSFNFTFNGQVWVCFRYCHFWRRAPAALDAWLANTAFMLRGLPWLDEALCIGSQGAGLGARSDRADIDLRLITPQGMGGWWRCNWLLLRLRSEAFLRLIPLDAYAYDAPSSLLRFRQDEPLLVIKDGAGRLRRSLAHRRLICVP
jgi:hypothetical protein